MVNSGQFNGISSQDARVKMPLWVEEQGWGKRTTNYKLREWLISRQRCWGTPIPMVHCDKCGIVPVDEKDLPVVQLLSGKNDTFESWFKCGFADIVASKLLSEGKIKPCVLVSGNYKGEAAAVVKASKFKTWAERQNELEKVLTQKCK